MCAIIFCVLFFISVMNSISIEDRISIIKCYYSSGKSATAALRKFKQSRGLIKDPFTTQGIQKLVDKFESTGSVHNQQKSGRPSLEEDRSAVVENSLKRNVSEIGCCSTKIISDDTNIPKSSVHRVLRNKLHMYP